MTGGRGKLADMRPNLEARSIPQSRSVHPQGRAPVGRRARHPAGHHAWHLLAECPEAQRHAHAGEHARHLHGGDRHRAARPLHGAEQGATFVTTACCRSAWRFSSLAGMEIGPRLRTHSLNAFSRAAMSPSNTRRAAWRSSSVRPVSASLLMPSMTACISGTFPRVAGASENRELRPSRGSG